MHATILELHNTLVRKAIYAEEDDAEYFGEAAIYIAQNPSLTVEQAKEYLRQELDTMLWEEVFEAVGLDA